MQNKMLIFDLDRTLLRDDKSISAYTQEVLHESHARGARLVFATARPERSISGYIAQVRPDAVIQLNGALVRATAMAAAEAAAEVCVANTLPHESAECVLGRIMREFPEARISTEVSGTLYANFDIPEWPGVTRYATFPALPAGDVFKLIIGLDAPEMHARISAMLPESMYASVANGTLLQIMSRAASKWNAVCELAEVWRIPISDIICFGDDNDDVEMLRNAGTGVAVSNAIPAALAAADYVAESNQVDGVAKYIVRHLLGT